MSNWISIGSKATKSPKKPACYVIFIDKTNLYVGSTDNLFKRLGQYKLRLGYCGGFITPWGTCQDLEIKYRPSERYGDWMMIEARLIKRLRPNLNSKGSTARWAANRKCPVVINNHAIVMASVREVTAGSKPLYTYSEAKEFMGIAKSDRA